MVLLVIVGFVALQAWCVAFIAAFVWLADLLPWDGAFPRLLMLLAAGVGLWLSLWLLARFTRSRL